MRLTVRQLKVLIAEGMNSLPPQSEVERQLQDSKFDKSLGAKALSSLERRLPATGKMMLQQLASALQQWQSDRVGWNVVLTALGRVYAGSQGPKRHSSYTGLKASRSLDRPSAA